MNLLDSFSTTHKYKYKLWNIYSDYIWVVNCNCKCNYVSYCNFNGVDRSKCIGIVVYKYHTIKHTKRAQNQMHFIFDCGTILSKTNLVCLFMC